METVLDSRLEKLIAEGKELSTEDFFAAYPGIPYPTVYSKIRSLITRGILIQVGRGRYSPVHKTEFKIPITDWMLEVNAFLTDRCNVVNHCVAQRGDNLHVEVARNDIPFVYSTLKGQYPKVALQKEADRFPAALEGFILVGRLISEAPMVDVDGCSVPSIEKELVDSLRNGEKTEWVSRMNLQRAMETYSLNMNRLKRYAARRGVEKELEERFSEIDYDRVELFSKMQSYFSRLSSVSQVWVFGSFARGEETPESDIDLLVAYKVGSKVSLLDMVRQKIDLEKLTGREVDLIENGQLKPFAIPTANRDKYLIYER